MLTPDEIATLADLERRLVNMVRVGTVATVDTSAALCRVQYDTDEVGGEVRTGWLPWATHRAGRDQDWWAPSVGEQVVVVAPSGDLAAGIVGFALYSAAHPAPSDAAD